MDGPPPAGTFLNEVTHWVEINVPLWKQTNSRNLTVIDQKLLQGIWSLGVLIFYRKIT